MNNLIRLVVLSGLLLPQTAWSEDGSDRLELSESESIEDPEFWAVVNMPNQEHEDALQEEQQAQAARLKEVERSKKEAKEKDQSFFLSEIDSLEESLLNSD